jgi:hypothetical protein
MKLFSTLIILCSVSNVFAQQPRQNGLSDGDRLAKIKATLPVVEKLYRDYAEKNNFPGLAFGVVVDGQLLYSGRWEKLTSKTLLRPLRNPCSGSRRCPRV